MSKNIEYELIYKTKGYPWRFFDRYKSKDDKELIKHHKNYSKSKIIEEVRVIKVTTTRDVIAI